MAKPPRAKSPKALHQPIYIATRLGIALASVGDLQATRARAASFGRAYATSRLGRKHLGRGIRNLATAFPEWAPDRVRDYAIRAHEHMFMLGSEFAATPRLVNDDAWPDHLELGDIGDAVRTLVSSRPVVLITGHCGNWEALGYSMTLMGFPMHALYRPLDLPPLDRWVRLSRQRRGLSVVDKFGALKQLPGLVSAGAPVGFVADQNGGDRGVFAPFFGRLTSTYKSIGLLAQQFGARVICGVARRMDAREARQPDGLRYRIELADGFGPEDWTPQPDPLFYITARYRRAIETMVRRAPEQYLWMHRIWRSRPRHERSNREFPAALEEKLRHLPWMTGEELERIKDQSARDAAELLRLGTDRLS
jgi:KDO2-lipid IV(A) lauroyltransferase